MSGWLVVVIWSVLAVVVVCLVTRLIQYGHGPDNENEENDL